MVVSLHHHACHVRHAQAYEGYWSAIGGGDSREKSCCGEGEQPCASDADAEVCGILLTEHPAIERREEEDLHADAHEVEKAEQKEVG